MTKTSQKASIVWVIYARQPLSLGELQHAVATPWMTDINPESLVPKTLLTSVCAGLVVIDEFESRSIVRLVRKWSIRLHYR